MRDETTSTRGTDSVKMIEIMAGKRSYDQAFEEFQSVSDVNHTSPKAKIHCVISGIPADMKEGSGNNFFDGK